ncbi:cytoglobin-1 [Biomphalaria glabrata]|nr:cytoglobin-1 [Biomphalaria glabrata]
MAEGVNTNNVSGSPGGTGQHVTDPRLPLSAMQIFKLKKNWKGVKRRLEDTGVEMLIRDPILVIVNVMACESILTSLQCLVSEMSASEGAKRDRTTCVFLYSGTI